MNKHGQFSFLAAGICFMATVIAIATSSPWLFVLSFFSCIGNIWIGISMIQKFDKKEKKFYN